MGERVCQTPGTIYQTSMGAPNVLRVQLVFPFKIDLWAQGSSAITVSERQLNTAKGRIKAYDQKYAERDRIDQLVHDAMEPVGADCYRVMRELDAAFGTDHVERGILRPWTPQQGWWEETIRQATERKRS